MLWTLINSTHLKSETHPIARRVLHATNAESRECLHHGQCDWMTSPLPSNRRVLQRNYEDPLLGYVKRVSTYDVDLVEGNWQAYAQSWIRALPVLRPCKYVSLFGPMQLRLRMLGYQSRHWFYRRMETPRMIYDGYWTHVCGALTTALYSNGNVELPLSRRRFSLRVPAGQNTDYHLVMADFQCLILIPETPFDVYRPLVEDMKDPFESMPSAVRDAKVDEADFQRVAETSGFDPYIIGALASKLMLEDMRTRPQWNSDGRYRRDGTRCHSNCIRFEDCTAYNASRYNADPHTRWQKLTDSDAYTGTVYEQEFTLAHLGDEHLDGCGAKSAFVGEPWEERRTVHPQYNYSAEVDKLLRRMQALQDRSELMKIRTFDTKIYARGLLELSHSVENRVSLRDYYFWTYGMSIVEHEVLVYVWKEKVRFSLIRPTTLIRAMGDKLIHAWDSETERLTQLPARDFQTAIRTMPHAEHPSGSSALCSQYVEYARAAAGDFRVISPDSMLNYGLDQWPRPYGGSFTFDLPSLHDFDEICGSTRETSGVHFSKAVPEGRRLVRGIGEKARRYVVAHGTKYYPDGVVETRVENVASPFCRP